MRLFTITAVMTVALVAAASGLARKQHRVSAMSLQERVQFQKDEIQRSRYTLRFFEHHPKILYSGPLRIRRIGWREVHYSSAHIKWTQLNLDRNVRLLAPPRPPHYDEWMCIHSHEGDWDDPNPPYYGGLQMDLEFQRDNGAQLLKEKGTADHWTPLEQMWVAEKAWMTRGFYPWPNTARWCGLI